ncbi:MAG: ATP-binding protein [Planctomycetes bacterium]|nr:ATP-binding protein [Planctomycetota bacterium]
MHRDEQPRLQHRKTVERLLRDAPCVALLGARQVGKSTLARMVAASTPGPVSSFDLEHPRDQRRLQTPLEALEDSRGLIVLDEIQHRPELFSVLRVLADRPRRPARFLILGSATPSMLQQSAESLAGRIAYHELGGFDLGELDDAPWRRLWVRGGYPRAYLARNEPLSLGWRQDLIRTQLQRDLPGLGVRIPPAALQRFWMMLAHWHGQIWNSAELARAFGVVEKTVRHYLDVLVGTFLVFRLNPWFQNIAKRQVKSPKVYLTDSGLLHALLGLPDHATLLGHPKVGASFEGFAIQQVIRRLQARAEECFFWASHAGAELDLLVVRGASRAGFECKLTDAPEITRSMRMAKESLGLERVDVVYPGPETFSLGEGFRALSVARLQDDLAPLP